MKYLRFLLIFAIVITALGFYQQPAKAGAFTYTSGISLQNLSDSPAGITIHYYNRDGTEDTNSPVTDTIPALGSKAYFPIHASTGFNGSVVIESNVLIASIVNVVGNNFAATAAYDGSSNGGSTLLLPLLMHENAGFNTWFNVQNAGGDVATVTVNYSDGTSNSASVPVGASFTFDQKTEAHPDPVKGKVFSAVVTSNQPIVATVIEENTKIMFAYSGFLSGSTTPVMPLINANNVGYQTGVSIQNTGDTDTVVTLSYTPSLAGTACTETQTIAAGKANIFALNAFAGAPLAGMTTNCAARARFIGSAIVSANSTNQSLTAIVNQLGPANGEAYGAFDPSAATETAVLPLIMNANSGYWSSLSIMNVGATNTTVTCSFTGVTAPKPSATLAPNQGVSFLTPSADMFGPTTKYIGAATCNAPGGSIVATSNELGPSLTADQLMVYEGFNK